MLSNSQLTSHGNEVFYFAPYCFVLIAGVNLFLKKNDLLLSALLWPISDFPNWIKTIRVSIYSCFASINKTIRIQTSTFCGMSKQQLLPRRKHDGLNLYFTYDTGFLQTLPIFSLDHTLIYIS